MANMDYGWNAHCSDVLYAKAFLDELDDHLELAALAGVARVWDGDGGIMLIDSVEDGIGHGG